jgi:hypothetical protein
MYVCILDGKGEIREHRNMNTNPETFLKVMLPPVSSGDTP